MNIVPSNIVKPFLEADMLQIIFMAILCGVAVGMIGDYSKSLKKLFEGFNLLFLKITTLDRTRKGHPLGRIMFHDIAHYADGNRNTAGYYQFFWNICAGISCYAHGLLCISVPDHQTESADPLKEACFGYAGKL